MTTSQKVSAMQNLKRKGELVPTDDNIPDELNPIYLYSCIATALLSQIVKGEIDPRELAWKELRNRGLDASGKWAGFPGYVAKEPKKPF